MSIPDRPLIIGSIERGPIRLVPFDPAWGERFQAERLQIMAALGDRAIAIEHIGSTAVPGLMAKPIIDILVSMRSPEEAFCCASLASVGYALRVRESGHLMFRNAVHDVHIAHS